MLLLLLVFDVVVDDDDASFGMSSFNLASISCQSVSQLFKLTGFSFSDTCCLVVVDDEISDDEDSVGGTIRMLCILASSDLDNGEDERERVSVSGCILGDLDDSDNDDDSDDSDDALYTGPILCTKYGRVMMGINYLCVCVEIRVLINSLNTPLLLLKVKPKIKKAFKLSIHFQKINNI